MPSKSRVSSLGAALLLVLSGLTAMAQGQDAAGAGDAAAPKAAVILDTTGFWRVHNTLKPPVVETADGLKPILHAPGWLTWDTPEPAEGWQGADFDDGNWLRGPALIGCRTPYLSRLCLRGKFTMTDPAQVGRLRLSVGYYGGAIAWVNGQEVGRAHRPPGDRGVTALAEGYTREVFVNDKGGLLFWDRRHRMPRGDAGRRVKLRERTLDVDIPTALLRKGVNVVAIEIVRAPYHKVVDEKKTEPAKGRPGYDINWNTCEVRRVQLTADRADGLVPAAVRPSGMQVWNNDLLASDFDLDFGDPSEPLRPVELVGVPRGVFSGKVVVGSDAPIRGLKATAGDLEGPGGRIPASAIRIRYALPWGIEEGSGGVEYGRYPRAASLLEALAESPQAEYPVREKKPGRYDLEPLGQPEPVFGAVVPVWITVAVPEGTKPGAYTGRVTVRAAGEKAVAVPVELTVLDWTMPKPADHATWVELMQLPDTTAVEYELDLWSDRHFKMIDRSMGYLGEIGSRVVYVPLICHTNLGNEQSMVRWVDKGNGRYEYDFSVMDRYLDIAERRMGKPRFVVFNVWDVYVGAKSKHGKATRSGEARALAYLKQRGAPLGEGPVVTMLDPAAKTAAPTELPGYAEPESKALWKPLISALIQRMRARGLEGSMLFGVATDSIPTKAEVTFFADLAPGVAWVGHSHHGFTHRAGFKLHGVAPIAYETRVWHTYFSSDPAKPGYGWKNPVLVAEYNRARNLDRLPPTKWRHIVELNITGGQRGIGRIGADNWRTIRDSKGQRKGKVADRYPQSSWRNLDLYTALLAPGPTGPVATARLEFLREGIQECEARIFIEKALTDDGLAAALGDDLAGRCREALQERSLYWWTAQTNLQLTGPIYKYATTWRTRVGAAGHYWFVGSGWQQRSRTLYGLASEVATKLSKS